MPVTLGRVVFSDKEDVEMSLGRKSLIPILFLVVAFAGTWAPVWAQNKYAYVANWTDNTVSGYLRDATTGALTQITGSPWATGNAPASVAVDQTGNCVFVANFLSNNVSAYKVTPATGVLTKVTGSPYMTGTAPIAVAVDNPFGQLVYVANAFDGSGSLGSTSAFQINALTCALTAVLGSPFRDTATPTPSNPSSVVVDRSGSFVYVTNEFSNNVSGFKINLTPGPSFGALTPVGAPIAAGTWPISAVAVPQSGVNFIYVSNDGSNNVSGYSFDGTTGVLTAVPGSPLSLTNATSPGLATIPGGFRQLYVPNFDSNNVSAINIFTTCTPPWPPSPCTPTGAMAEVTGSPFRTGSGPTSVAVDPSGKFAYVTSMLSNNVWGYNINGSNGALTVSGAPVPAGQFAISVFFTP